MTETDISRAIKQTLRALGWWVERNNSGRSRNRGVVFGLGGKGGPDLVAQRNGVAVALEVKGPRGKQSEDQQLWEQGWCAHGGTYAIVHCPEEAVAACNAAVLAVVEWAKQWEQVMP